MTKDEAERRASDHAMEDQDYPDKDNIDQERYETYVKAYLKCWEDVRKGEPDGWAWTEGSEFRSSPEIAWDNPHSPELAIELARHHESGKDWKILPVKLLVMQEPEK